MYNEFSGKDAGLAPVKKLFLLAMLLVTASAFASEPRQKYIFNIMDYGAVGDGKTLCTAAIQSAIDSCAFSGGGEVYVPPGVFLTGSLILKNHVEFYLEKNSVILGSKQLSDYSAGVLIFALDREDVSIEGGGKIDGQGRSFWEGKERLFSRPNGLVRFENCRRVFVSDVELTDSPKFNLYFDRCEDVHVDAIRIVNSLDSPNTDGIDIANTSDVFISNSYIETGDDAICLKSNKTDYEVSGVVVTNCIIISDDTALKLGTGSQQRISDCLFSNIAVREATNGIGLFMKDGGIFENIQFYGINMETLANPKKYFPADGGAAYWRRVLEKRSSYPIFVDTESRDGIAKPGLIRNVMFSDIIINNYDGNCLISGDARRPLEDISLINIRVNVLSKKSFSGRSKPRGTRTLTNKPSNDFSRVQSHFTFAYVKNLKLKNITVEDRAAERGIPFNLIWGKEVDHSTFDCVTLVEDEVAGRVPEVVLNDCRDLLVTGCKGADTRSSFLYVEGKRTKDIKLIGNDFSSMKRPLIIDPQVKDEVRAAWNLLRK